LGPDDPPERHSTKNTAEDEAALRVLREHHLPTAGAFPFVPPKNWRAHQPLRRNSKGEYIDLKGRRWLALKQWRENSSRPYPFPFVSHVSVRFDLRRLAIGLARVANA
jgi:hypothetical protein